MSNEITVKLKCSIKEQGIKTSQKWVAEEWEN